jgi:hypothetical protein
MNIKLIAGIIIAAAVAGGGYWYATRAADPAAPGEASADDSYATALRDGGAHECTVHITVNGSTSDGTVYISGTDVRGEFQSVAAGRTIRSSLIRVGGYVYVWSDAYPQGFQTEATTDTDPLAALAPTSGETHGATYSCHAWTADASKFVLPKGVTFTKMPR